MPLNQELLNILKRIGEGQSKLVTLQRFDLSNVNLKEKDAEDKTYLHRAAIILKELLEQLASKEISQEDKNVVEQRVAELVKAMEYLIQKGVPALEEDTEGDKFTKGLTIIENVYVDKLLILEQFEKVSFLCTRGVIQPSQINRLIDRIRNYNNSEVRGKIDINSMKNQTGLTLMEVIIGTKFPTNFRESDYTFINTILVSNDDMFDFRYVNDKGQTFLHMAVEKKLLDVLPLFIVRGTDKNAKDRESKTYDEYLTEEERQRVTGKVKELESRQGTDEAFRIIDFEKIDDFKRYVEEHNIKFTAANSEGVTLAEYAADHLNIEVIKYMIEKDPMLLTGRFKDNNTLLHIIMNSNVVDDKARQDLIDFILSKETKSEFINAKNSFNDTALSIAVEKNMYEEIVKLIESGVDINLPSEPESLPPLFILVRNMCATKSEDFRLLEVLVKNGALKVCEVRDEVTHQVRQISIEDYIRTNDSTYRENLEDVLYSEKKLLREAIQRNDSQTIREFFESNLSVKVDDIRYNDYETLLMIAAKQNNAGIVRLLLEKGADIHSTDIWYNTALHMAAGEGHKGVVELLLEKGADVNAGLVHTALHMAAEKGHKEVVEVLLKNGADVNAGFPHAALHRAVREGHKEIVEVLLKNGAYVNARSRWDYTALHMAAEKGYKEVVEVLLKNGADIFIRNSSGETPLDCVDKDRSDIREIICEHKQKIRELTSAITNKDISKIRAILNGNMKLLNSGDRNNETLREKIIINLDSAMVKELVGDLNLQYNNGRTLLHYAAQVDKNQLVKALIEKGIDIFIRDKRGKMAVDYANSYDVLILLNKKMIEEYIQDPSFISAKLVQEAKSALKRTGNKFAMWRTKSRLEILESLQKIRESLEKSRNKEEFMSIAKKIKNGEPIEGEPNIVWDATDEAGNTLLHLAVRAGNKDAVRFLVSKVDVNICNNMGYTPLFMAATKKNEPLSDEIILILKEHNAKMRVEDNKTTVGYKKVFSQHCKTRDGRRLIECLQQKVNKQVRIIE